MVPFLFLPSQIKSIDRGCNPTKHLNKKGNTSLFQESGQFSVTSQLSFLAHPNPHTKVCLILPAQGSTGSSLQYLVLWGQTKWTMCIIEVLEKLILYYYIKHRHHSGNIQKYLCHLFIFETHFTSASLTNDLHYKMNSLMDMTSRPFAASLSCHVPSFVSLLHCLPCSEPTANLFVHLSG